MNYGNHWDIIKDIQNKISIAVHESYGSSICYYLYAISAYHQYHYEFGSRSWWDVPDTTLCDQVCQWLAAGGHICDQQNHQTLNYLVTGHQIYSACSRHSYGNQRSPILADLFLYSYEAVVIQWIIKKNEKKLACSFNFTFRYIFDVLLRDK
jgi:hypothetical protein